MAVRSDDDPQAALQVADWTEEHSLIKPTARPAAVPGYATFVLTSKNGMSARLKRSEESTFDRWDAPANSA